MDYCSNVPELQWNIVSVQQIFKDMFTRRGLDGLKVRGYGWGIRCLTFRCWDGIDIRAGIGIRLFIVLLCEGKWATHASQTIAVTDLQSIEQEFPKQTPTASHACNLRQDLVNLARVCNLFFSWRRRRTLVYSRCRDSKH